MTRSQRNITPGKGDISTFYVGLSDGDLHIIAEGCYMERIDLCNRIRRPQATMKAIASDVGSEINSTMTREERGGLP